MISEADIQGMQRRRLRHIQGNIDELPMAVKDQWLKSLAATIKHLLETRFPNNSLASITVEQIITVTQKAREELSHLVCSMILQKRRGAHIEATTRRRPGR